jgi:hypothetical protein
MFGLPALIWDVFLPSLRQGLPDPLPAYEKVLLDIAVFCGEWKWLLALPIMALGLLFTIAEVTTSRATDKLDLAFLFPSLAKMASQLSLDCREQAIDEAQEHLPFTCGGHPTECSRCRKPGQKPDRRVARHVATLPSG